MKHHKLLPVWLLILLLLHLRTASFAVDLYDTAPFTNSLQKNCDINFQKLCEHYGLRCKVIDLSTVTLTDNLLRDESGEYLKAVFVSGHALENCAYLDSNEIEILENGVEIGGINLFIFIKEITSGHQSVLKKLTDNVITGAIYPRDSSTDYIISDSFPEITQEFTGLKLSHPARQTNFTITVGPNSTSNIDVIVAATDDSFNLYSVFTRY